ncbi:MAG TPA: XDD4 family exosortase-dependent surface protein [Pirellulales bacterium]|nr:XDD4 family exosortase-dependent surface protein [Pirellulales bacterium]
MLLRSAFAYGLIAVSSMLLVTSQSDADVVVSKDFAGSGVFQVGGHSVTLSADALFTLDKTTDVLTVLLSNTSPAAGFKIGGAEVLTELFFNATDKLTPISATLPSGSHIVGSVPAGQTLGGNWEYLATSHAPSDIPNHVLASSGVYAKAPHKHSAATFGPPSRHGFGGPSWGLVDTSDRRGIARGDLPVVDNQILFAFQADPHFTLNELGPSVVFQFGTTRHGPELVGPDPPSPNADAPEPGSLAIWGVLGLAGIVYRRRRV